LSIFAFNGDLGEGHRPYPANRPQAVLPLPLRVALRCVAREIETLSASVSLATHAMHRAAVIEIARLSTSVGYIAGVIGFFKFS